jgi:hypothetical protein
MASRAIVDVASRMPRAGDHRVQPACRAGPGWNPEYRVFISRLFCFAAVVPAPQPHTVLTPMSTSVPSVTPRIIPARRDRIFHTGMAIACLITAFVGFGPTYFYKPVYQSPPLSPLLHVHGLVFTTWLVLLVVQSGLVRADRVAWHKRLGIAGAALAAGMVILGLMAAVHAARRGVAADGMTPLAFMIFPFGQTLLFGAFVGLGLWKRRQPELHRRFILLGTICLMTPAISRIVDHRAVLASILTLAFVVVAMIHDWKSRRRVHPIYIYGGIILFAAGPLRAAIANTSAWQSFARLITG